MSKGSRIGMTPHSPSGKMCHDLCVNRPELNVEQVTALVQAEYPKHTEAATRMLLHRYGLKITKREYAQRKSTSTVYKGKPVAETTAPKPVATHTPIQSYHGRSRYLPAYYEL